MQAQLIENMGSDLTVVNAARVSFSKESEWEYYDEDGRGPSSSSSPCGEYFNIRKLPTQDNKLINYLAKHNHWTPFSHPQIMMREKVPIFVARQRFKHMVGFTYNEVSRRYVDDGPEFFTPDVWRSRPEGSVKQGSGSALMSQDYVQAAVDHVHSTAWSTYSRLLASNVAPEQARMVLPQSMYTEYYVTGSLSAWARAYKQRIDAHAQMEIQDLARSWNDIIAPLYPKSWEALTQ